jgi:hypothetical protein
MMAAKKCGNAIAGKKDLPISMAVEKCMAKK